LNTPLLLLGALLAAADGSPAHPAPGGNEASGAPREFRWGADAQGGAPYIFQDPMDPNRIIGFEVDLADALARRLGYRSHPVSGSWDKLLELLARGDFDYAINGIEVADEKKRIALLWRPSGSPFARAMRRRPAPSPR
jgi:polar amino acid transport system substrate-binding protein